MRMQHISTTFIGDDLLHGRSSEYRYETRQKPQRKKHPDDFSESYVARKTDCSFILATVNIFSRNKFMRGGIKSR